MAAPDQPTGLMDIASTLTQDEIPFKLRCAVCNKLAMNAFRLPCCDQAICESCQTSLPETCPVCAHTPISSDLCKPNKALRTTLKAFLRTEEKKREKDRQQATPTVSVDATPTEPTSATQETPRATDVPQGAHVEEKPATDPTSDSLPVQTSIEQPPEVIAENIPDTQDETAALPPIEGEEPENRGTEVQNADEADHNDHNGDATVDPNGGGSQPPGSMPPNPMGMNMGAGGVQNMGWSAAGDFNPMTQFMANGMLNFQNPMGMPGIPGMTMDPMAQGMFGGYGMNMNGMSSGMMGMGFDAGQGMYGGWDGSQSNMWNGGQDKFNPNAFANGMGPQYGGPSGFGGFNMSQPNGFPNQNYQNGYYGPGYSRGNFRGRGRGFYYGGRGRGGFMAQGQGHTNFSHNANSPTLQNQNNFNQEPQSQEGAADEAPPADQEVATKPDGEAGPDDEQAGSAAADTTNADEMSAQGQPADVPSTEAMQGDESQLHGIPTVDTFQQPNAMGFMPMGHAAMSGPMGMGYGRAGYMRGGYGGGGRGGFGPFTPGPGPNMPPPNPGVEGAPAAPRAMREGLPNTSVFRHRGYQPQARGSLPAVKPVDGSQTTTPGAEHAQPDSTTRSRSRSRSRSKPRSPSRSRSRSNSRSRDRHHRRHRSPSYDHDPSDGDRERRRDRRRRSRREDKYDDISADEHERRTRSPSMESSRRSSRRRDRDRDRDRGRRSGRRSHRSRRHRSRTRTRSPSPSHESGLPTVPEENGDTDAIPSSRSHRSRKDRSSRHDSDRESRRRDRDRSHRDHDRHRRHGRKRSRRDRTESPESEYRSRRSKRNRGDGDDPERERERDRPSEPSKDPHTLEREARNRERLLKEQQRREAVNTDRPGRKRVGSSRRLSYKYEDEESDAARAARVESEREASRWA